MRCHYCGQEAAYEAETGGVIVGLCAPHFREQIEEIAESDGLTALTNQINIDADNSKENESGEP